MGRAAGMALKLKVKPVLGLDISTSSVKVLELTKTGTSYRARCYGVEPMPANAVTGKSVTDIEAVGEAVRMACKRSGSRLKDTAVAIGGPTVVTKVLNIPAGLTPREEEEQVQVIAGREVPYPLDEVAWDFDFLPSANHEQDGNNVLFVATKKENVANLEAVLEYAGLHGYIVDAEAMALERAYGLLSGQLENSGSDRTIMLVDFGASTTTFSVFDDNKIIYTRDQSFGGRQLTDEIMRRYSLSYEEAGRAKRRGGLPQDYQESVLEPFMTDMGQQVNRALQYYYASTTEHASVDQVVVCGGCAAIPNVDSVIAEEVGISTCVANPFERVSLTGKAQAQGIEQDAPSLMIAAGLALRSFD